MRSPQDWVQSNSHRGGCVIHGFPDFTDLESLDGWPIRAVGSSMAADQPFAVRQGGRSGSERRRQSAVRERCLVDSEIGRALAGPAATLRQVEDGAQAVHAVGATQCMGEGL